MELVHNKKGDISSYEAVRRISEPIYRSFLKEVSSDTMSINNGLILVPWRPNNYRRQAKLLVYKDTTLKNHLKGVYPNSKLTKKNIWICEDYKGVMLMFFKKTITGIYTQKGVLKLKAKSFEELKSLILEEKERIKTIIDEALNSFIKKHNLIIDGTIDWLRSENWTNNKQISKLPEDFIIDTPDWKKVYKTGFEEKTKKGEEPTEKLIKHISNTLIQEISPEIAESIQLVNPLRALKQKCNSITDIIENKRLVGLLSDKEKKELNSWSFERFGISG